MGDAMGAIAVFDAVEAGLFAYAGSEHFRSAIACDPNCAASRGSMTAPTLIRIGDRANWTPAAACRKMASGESDIGITREPSPADLIPHPRLSQQYWRI
jgi:hypothetical protein